MDVNVTITDLRDAAIAVFDVVDNSTGDSASTRADDAALAALALEMAEKFTALDKWLRMGGFLPVGWER